MAGSFSGKALILEEGDAIKIFTDDNQTDHIMVSKDQVEFLEKDRGENVDLGNGLPLRIAGVSFEFPEIPIPGAVCEAAINVALAADPIRPVKQLIDAARAQGGIGKIDTAELAQACQDRAKALEVLSKFIPEPAAKTVFEVVSKFGQCCPRFYERLLNE